MEHRTLTLGHSPDPDDAFMFYALAKELIPTNGFKFRHILQDIQTLNERALRGDLTSPPSASTPTLTSDRTRSCPAAQAWAMAMGRYRGGTQIRAR
jgi:predicted solute-binding protein